MERRFNSRGVVTLTFNPGALMKGRIVKTLTYSRTTTTDFRDCNLNASQEIQSWCNLKMRVESCDLKRGIVTLNYTDKFGTEIIEWPITCLDKTYGIKIN